MSSVRIYQIEAKDLDKAKKVLEAAEVDPELESVLKQRAKMEKAKKDSVVSEEMKALDAKIEQLKAAGKMKVNEFARNGYILRAAKGISLTGEQSYLYIKAPDDSFFARNEKALLSAGVKALKGEEFEKAKKAFESEEESSAAGMGFIFGG